MPRDIPTELRVYESDPTSTTVTWSLVPNRLNALKHRSRLPGGFHILEIEIPVTPGEYSQWRNERIFYRAILEQGATTLWEGRLENITIADLGKIRLTFRGYFRTFVDTIDDNATYSRSYNLTGDAIIKDMLDNAFHADAQTPNTTDQTNIDAPGHTAINRNYDSDHPEWSLWDILTDSTVGVLTFGDSSDNKMDFAIWENRIVHYSARNPTTVDWLAYLYDPALASVKNFPAQIDTESLGTAVKAVYDSGGITETAYNADSTQITKYARVERAIPNMGSVSAANAQEARDTRLASTKELQQRTDSLTLTRIFDANGIEQPLCRVRAGDVLRIADWQPTTAGLGSASLDALRTFVLEEVECNHSTNELRVRPDFPSRSVSSRLARNRIQ